MISKDIHDNIKHLYLYIHKSNFSKQGALAISLNVFKEFNTVHWDDLWETMSHLGFGHALESISMCLIPFPSCRLPTFPFIFCISHGVLGFVHQWGYLLGLSGGGEFIHR